MASEPPKLSVSLRSKRVLLRDQANATLQIDNQGRHEEALATAVELVDNNRGVSLVHKLLGIIYQRKAARLDSDVLANSFREKACAAFSEAARLAPKCLLAAVEHAEALAECGKYDDAYAELIRVRNVAFPVDPGQSYVGCESDKFSIKDTTYSDRLATARDKAANAMERLKKQIQHRDTLSKVEEFWQNYPSKDAFNTVCVEELCEYHGRVNLSKSVRDACSLVKEHNRWGLFVWHDREFMDISLLCHHLHNTHQEVWPMLVDMVGAKMFGPAAQIPKPFSDIKFSEDDQQRDIVHLPSVEHVIAAMQVYPCAELPSEMEIKVNKCSEAVKIFEGIIEAIKGFTADVERAKVEEQIQSSWNDFLQSCYFDYREVVLPLATKFQWDKLKNCMDKASEMQSCKEPSPLLLCSKCWNSGHGIKDCNLCIICGSNQHTIAYCPLTKEAKPLANLVGYATPGQEFFIDNEPGSRHVTAQISVEAGTLTVDQLVGEFFSQFDWGWDWSAKQLGHNLFVMKFPNLGKVEELSKSTLQLEKSGAMIRVSKRASEPVPKAKLCRVWVTVDGIPETKKHYKSLCAIGSMVGAVQEVDIETLEEFDIVRIMVDVKDPQNFPLSQEYGVPPDLYDLYFSLESVVTAGGAYEEGNKGPGDDHNSQGNHSHQYWSQTRLSNAPSHQSGRPSSSTEIGSGDSHVQSAGNKIVMGTHHSIITPESMGRLQSRQDFQGSSKGPVDNGAEEARKMQIQKDFELAILLNQRLKGGPRRSEDATFNAADVHENWEPEDKAALEQIRKLMDDHQLDVQLQNKLYQDGDDDTKVVFQKKKPPRNPGKGGDLQKTHVKPSTLNSHGGLQTPLWLKTEKKQRPQDLPTKVFNGQEISLKDTRKFALYCKAATNCPDKYTICHVCSFEGVSDRRIEKKKMKEHFDKFHEQPGVSYECDVCETRGRTSMDIRKHHYFAHKLSADWWPAYIPSLDL